MPDGISIEAVANGLLIFVIGILGYFGIRGGVKSDPSRGESGITITSPLVDTKAIEKLTLEVTGQSVATHSQAVATRDQTKAIERQTEAIVSLQEEIADLKDLTRAVTDVATQIARAK